MKRFTLCLALVVLGALAASPAARAAEPFAHGCPKEALEEGSISRLNRDPAAKKAIVPAGATSVRLCRYYGLGEFDKQTPKTQARAGELQDQADVHGSGLLESLRFEFQELEAAPKGSKKAPPHSTNGVKEKSAVAYPPPHLTLGKAAHEAKGALEFFCEESGLCESQSIGQCTRNTAAAIGCRYTAALKSGEVCRGTLHVTALGGGMISDSPGVVSSKEGECFVLFEPRAVREVEGKEEEREAKG